MKYSRFAVIVVLFVCAFSAAILRHSFFLMEFLPVVFFVVLGFGVAIPQLRFFGNFICSGNGSKKHVALTFDDGPDANSTPQLLDLLRAEKVPAAFFCIGKNVEQNPEITARILSEGHLVENHSFAHSNYTNFYGREKLKTELLRAQTAVEKATGIAPKFFRPPVGLSNPNTFRVARDLNLKVVGWNIRSLDTITSRPKTVVARIRRNLWPGSIILLHDGKIPAERLLATVKSLLDELRKLDYEVVRLDELLK
ncbi:MAG TPA: polysaccharide deacetylase family protein [Candidatus Sulfotelmatobacter sp.]|jgi:peptidoglycan/xylan/chitin deacetylase (PgdA/CDA1 family)|nr:polysaccharide deacetylase family protein [Candidatus Sulfotelmatobacter sp.]